jgi:hypothetical protein
MDYAYFSFMNRAPLGQRTDISDKESLNKGLDLLMMLIGDYSLHGYTELALTNLRVYSRYSIQMGIVYLDGYLHDSNMLIAPKPIPLLGGVDILNRTFCIIAEGLTDEVFRDPYPFPTALPAAGLFKRLFARDMELIWAATLKPYSWRASPWWELPAPIMITFPPETFAYKPFLVIIIGDAPSMAGNDPIYVSGEIGYTL